MSKINDIDEQLICDYLTHHPDFLLNHPYVLLDMDLHGKSLGLPNLALQQQRVLREQNIQLKQQIATMARSAIENEQIFRLLSECQRQLWCCNSLGELTQKLDEFLCQQPNIVSCKLIPYHSELADLAQTRLQNGVYLGRLSQQELQLFWPQEASIQSVALYMLGSISAPDAILAFASNHAEHFAPTNDTLFMQEFVTTLQVRFSALA
ncbi:DUF484 family protein [Pseudoalteromonas sp. JBTF-M23]|uniref:DUF484 family protein n=1 Tax=Pseudoalteromonas caenipelagi TaxID=2726988 RepID=A0A849VK19_9GAMM|nr:DUF484 family protein [Pseudoalteromonas caenipelagi]NOU52988.1 DUF484 family protein [Pseudoalteromonas caenipelagi]